jgi:multicomponent Na+:H+ antiporter subunit C
MLALGQPLLAMPGTWAVYLIETAMMVSIARDAGAAVRRRAGLAGGGDDVGHRLGIAAASIFGIGLYSLIVARHLLRQLIAINVMGSAVFVLLVVAAGPIDGALDGIPKALVLTGIVVAVSATGFALALVVRLAEVTGSISPGGAEADDDR